MRYRTLAAFTVLSLIAFAAFASGVPKDELEDNGRGIITNYSNMQEGDDIDWYWIAPGTKLEDDTCTLASFKNLTSKIDDDMREVFKKDLPIVFKHECNGGAHATHLHVDVAVYWADLAHSGKAWIPFAGAHLAQAGVGIELVFKDSSGKVVAKIRHSAREGDELEDAAHEVIDDIGEFIDEH